MKKLISILICCSIYSKALAQEVYKEYGIALILPPEYSIEAQKMNKEIAAQVPTATNMPNVFHVTLFQGCFAETKIGKLYLELKNQNFKKIKIRLAPEIKTAEDHYINWSVHKSKELQNLHKAAVKIANPYHQGILARYLDSINELNKKQRSQVVIYGMSGLLDEYNPHVTLFYFAKKSSEIKNIAKKISPPKLTKGSPAPEAYSIAIAELGYNGNIEKVLYSIELK